METMKQMGFKMIDCTRFVTAASEIARNTLIHGGGGEMKISTIRENGRTGLQLLFRDQGPGIPEVEQALRPGYTTGKGMGKGLSGAKNLSHRFSISCPPGEGCNVTLVRWK